MKKPKATKEKAPRKDPRIEEIYEEEVEFMCPVRGLVKQKVKIKRYKSLQEIEERRLIASRDALSQLEETDDGLEIYSDGEALDVGGPPSEDSND
jgi:hypothetical protein